MLKFNKAKYGKDSQNIDADQISTLGFQNAVAVGGSRAVMLEIEEITKQITAIPVYTEQADMC